MVNGHLSHNPTAPAGLRISYAALAIVVPILVALGGLLGTVRKNDLENIESAIASARVAQTTEDAALRSAQSSDIARVERRLERIEDKLDALSRPGPK